MGISGTQPAFPPRERAGLVKGSLTTIVLICPDCPFIFHRLSLWSGLRKHAELRDPSNYVPWTMQSLGKQNALSAFNYTFSRTVRLDGLKGCMVWHRKHLDPLIYLFASQKTLTTLTDWFCLFGMHWHFLSDFPHPHFFAMVHQFR